MNGVTTAGLQLYLSINAICDKIISMGIKYYSVDHVKPGIKYYSVDHVKPGIFLAIYHPYTHKKKKKEASVRLQH